RKVRLHVLVSRLCQSIAVVAAPRLLRLLLSAVVLATTRQHTRFGKPFRGYHRAETESLRSGKESVCKDALGSDHHGTSCRIAAVARSDCFANAAN
ncbi:MAG: hypothetical protein ACO3FE_07670, partial [Planctomycetaceae bacterium]